MSGSQRLSDEEKQEMLKDSMNTEPLPPPDRLRQIISSEHDDIFYGNINTLTE